MALYTYNNDIPDGPNNPSQDQPLMKVNTNSIDDLINEDHVSFNLANGGFHRQMRVPEQGTIPSGLITSSGTLYVKPALSVTAATNRGQLFYTNSTSNNEYQLTRVDNAQFSKFGTNTTYQADHEGGWTFLPGNAGNTVTPLAATGGLIFMYGKRLAITGANPSIVVTFPFPFPSALYNVQCTPIAGVTNATFQRITASSTTDFTISFTGIAGAMSLYWTAIGV